MQLKCNFPTDISNEMTGDVADFFLTISKSSDHIIVSMGRRVIDSFIDWKIS